MSFECKMLVAVFSRWPVCQAAVRAAVRSSRYYGKVCRILCDVTDEDLTDMSHSDTLFLVDQFEVELEWRECEFMYKVIMKGLDSDTF